MNRTYLVVPLVSMAMFAGYFIYSRSHPAPPRQVETKAADPYLERDGKKEAGAEIAAGKLGFIETGLGVSWEAERREIAASKYGVELRRVTEVTSEAFARYINSYNRVMRPKILERHGRGFFETLHQEAIALMESRRSGKTAAPAATTPR